MRQPLPEFLSKQSVVSPHVAECHCRHNELEIVLIDSTRVWRIFCTNPIDYAIRPIDPRLYFGFPPLQWSMHDPKLLIRRFQYLPGGDGELFEPPMRWQIITINQSYVVAERFEIERILPSSGSNEAGSSEYVQHHTLLASVPTRFTPIEWDSLEIAFKD